MFSRREAIFRKEALERLSTPERLDELVAIVDPHSWIALVTLALLIAGALVWSVVGRLPITVTGRGVVKGAAGVMDFPIKDGARIELGMKVQVSPDSVERERYGSMAGVVRSVSSSPVTKAGGPRIEVIVDLEHDPSTISGYRWSSSKGPPMRIGSGLTATARVTVENRAPITYLLPLLRRNAGDH